MLYSLHFFHYKSSFRRALSGSLVWRLIYIPVTVKLQDSPGRTGVLPIINYFKVVRGLLQRYRGARNQLIDRILLIVQRYDK